jgi:large repetitive protein
MARWTPRRWRPRRWRWCVAVVVASLVLGSGVAIAASLSITTNNLTTSTILATVPISTCTLTSSADSYVAEDDDSNFGSEATLHVQSYQTTIVILTTHRNRRSFVRFDLSSCSIPAAAAVQSATLSVFLWAAPNQNRTWNINRVTGAWTESGITWSNQPASTSSTSVTTGTTSNVTLQATVTSDVQSFVSGSQTNNGWRFSDSVENSSTQRNGQFRSREFGTASQRPTLVVNYYP